MNYKIVLTPDAIKNIDDAIDYYKTVASVKVAKSFIDDYNTKHSYKIAQSTSSFSPKFQKKIIT
jgi:toxin ParE1/3/4